MTTGSLLSPWQHLLRIGASVAGVFFAFVLFNAYHLHLASQHQLLPEGTINFHHQQGIPDPQSNFPVKNASPAVFNIPPAYAGVEKPPPSCDDRFGDSYLRQLRHSATEYCTPESQSGLTCFHSKTAAGRTDSFCLARGAHFNQVDRKFTLGCSLRDLGGLVVPRYDELTNYWYDTGPGIVLQETVVIDEGNSSLRVPDTVPNYTLLAKREGSENIWHSLMEIFSMTLTLDVLRMAQHPDKPTPLFTHADIANTQVLLLDEMADGPYLDLWSLFAPKPLLRINNRTLPRLTTSFENLIVPLSGGGNPLWQGDWEIHTCVESSLLRTFSRRVLNHYHLDSDAQRNQPADITVTFINRTTTRHLVNAAEYLTHLESKLPHTRVKSVDFASIPFAEQLAVAQQTDVLVGVHGAGLTHGIFLPPHSAVVEILPPGLNHKGFRNVAALLGHSYFSAYATESIRPARSSEDEVLGTQEERDWHREDVFIEQDVFMDLMDLAVKAIYNRGSRIYDV
ncbi:uncharacterized protein APUU_50175S [Aspergillus puulaauensis]|uniref:EGF domain-specific O-linked N-acetylglucosamine transferase n=1 Tax=Aspergillus puulaauensis TaxID=1220207 RepID=A0A7R8AMW7_9EURO|nr:uncharacterized protein APUU_50175S [Aspergillus puulaauensis]BCS25464.1 hypothetical protein APUU_50175S [Aspergillus puulaauensis]